MSFFSVSRPLIAALVVGVAGFAASVAQACPDWQQTGQQIRYSADQLWSPQTLSVIAGGGDNLRNCSQPGVGYVATRPDFDFNFSDNNAGRDLDFRVNAACDTVILVNDARGQWHFNDDGGDGLNARLRIPNAPAGSYDIWVGTYGPSTCQATLTLETFGGVSVTPPTPQAPIGVLPDPGNMVSYRNRTGDVLMIQVTGTDSGSVWGSGIYTDDSRVARAAVHAGLVQVGQTAVVYVQLMPGQPSYQGSNQYGVQSSNYGSWTGSYQFVRGGAEPQAGGQSGK